MRWPIRFTSPPWFARGLDLLLAVGAAGLGVWRELVVGSGARMVALPIAFYLGAHVVSAVILLERRRYPVLVGSLIAVLCLITPTYAAIAVPYSLTAYATTPRQAVGTSVAVLVGWSLGSELWTLRDPISGPLGIALAAVLGLYVGARRRLYGALVDRAERAEREQLLIEAQSRSDERSKLASEMHDVVTHRVTLMVLHAGALQVTSQDPQVRQAAEDLRASGAEALEELRDLIGVLRAGAEVDSDSVGGYDLSDLVAASVRAGLMVRLEQEGHIADLAPAIARTLYRVVQESITNACKHAPGGRIEVRTRYDVSGVQVQIRNWSGRLRSGLAISGSGSGLVSLRERVSLLGGSFDARTEGAGKFLVAASLPASVPGEAIS